MLGGTKLYCPNCRQVTVCSAVPTTELGEQSGQRFHFADHCDIHWFRRGRECQSCYHLFLTAEVPEHLVDELAELRMQVANAPASSENATHFTDMNSSEIDEEFDPDSEIEAVANQLPWLYFCDQEEADVPMRVIHGLVSKCVWCRESGSEHPMRTSKFADHLICDGKHWYVEFNEYSFVPDLFIKRVGHLLTNEFMRIIEGGEYHRGFLMNRMRSAIEDCVAKSNRQLVNVPYGLKKDELVFDQYSVDFKDAANYILSLSKIEELEKKVKSKNSRNIDLK